MSEHDLTAENKALTNALMRERKARKLAESLLEERAVELFLANRELQESIKTLKASNLQLLQSEKMASIGQLAAGIAHEVNNPVGFISSNLSTLRDYIEDVRQVIAAQRFAIKTGVDCKDAQRYVEINAKAIADLNTLLEKVDLDFLMVDMNDLLDESIDGIDRIRKIVADLLDFSRTNSSEYKNADINALIEKSLNVAWNELKYKTDVNRDFGELPAVYCNDGKLTQVFLNLLLNASHAIEDYGEITIKTRRAGDNVSIIVSDTGVGISENVIANIFDPFFTTKSVSEGTGLGLHIVRSVIDAHQGTITVDSELGKGTSFTILLPILGVDA
ncbi:ATP-binding protein [Pseudomonadales bacterium]|nr:ATP-binding protein [Pseudomonadales bacterium]